MATDRMFELAFRLRKTGVWNEYPDGILFAVRMENGTVLYCTLTGNTAAGMTAAAYIGERGLRGLRKAKEWEQREENGFSVETLAEQDCLQCFFDKKDRFPPEIRKEVSDYAKRSGTRITGRFSYMMFARVHPYACPVLPDTEEDETAACAMLGAALCLAENPEKPDGISLDGGTRIACFEQTGDGWNKTELRLPEDNAPDYPHPEMENDILAASIRKLTRTGEWECGLFIPKEPAISDEDDIPRYYCVPVLLDVDGEMIASGEPITDPDTNAGLLLADICRVFKEEGRRPAYIRTDHPRMYALLQDFSRATGIRLELCEDLPMLKEAMEEMENSAEEEGGEQDGNSSNDKMLDFLVEQLESLTPAEMKEMPEEIRSMLRNMMGTGTLPESLENKLKDAWKDQGE